MERSQGLGLDKAITTPITREVLAEQQAMADLFLERKLLPKKLNLLDAAPLNL